MGRNIRVWKGHIPGQEKGQVKLDVTANRAGLAGWHHFRGLHELFWKKKKPHGDAGVGERISVRSIGGRLERS